MQQNPFLAEQGVASFGQSGIVVKGYSTSAVNGTKSYTISQPGNMSKLVGIAIFAEAAIPLVETVSLIIDSTQVLDSIPAAAICPQTNGGGLSGFANPGGPFFLLMRNITPSTQIKLDITGTGNKTLTTVFYFMP